jgi:hypothetical protein
MSGPRFITLDKFPHFAIFPNHDYALGPNAKYVHMQSVVNGWPVVVKPAFLFRKEVISAICSIEECDNRLLVVFDREIDGMNGVFFTRY